jgi:hypothetical protein
MLSVKAKLEKLVFKKAIAICISFFSTFMYGNDIDTPRTLVQSFISDYQKWNDKAHSLSEAEVEYTGEAMSMAKSLYHKNIISKYCKPNFKAQPIAFGSDSSHDSEHEVILKEEIDGDKATIITQHTDSNDFVADYEYRLIKESGRWFLEAVDYVDSDGKYPGL